MYNFSFIIILFNTLLTHTPDTSIESRTKKYSQIFYFILIIATTLLYRTTIVLSHSFSSWNKKKIWQQKISSFYSSRSISLHRTIPSKPLLPLLRRALYINTVRKYKPKTFQSHSHPPYYSILQQKPPYISRAHTYNHKNSNVVYFIFFLPHPFCTAPTPSNNSGDAQKKIIIIIIMGGVVCTVYIYVCISECVHFYRGS